MKDAPNVSVVEIPLNDGWARDWGPSVSSSKQRAVCSLCWAWADVVACVQCIARNNPDTGKREIAGTHWDFDSYGGTRKRAMGEAAQVGVLDRATLNLLPALTSAPLWSQQAAPRRHALPCSPACLLVRRLLLCNAEAP